MPPAARITDLHTCPAATGPVPHVGGPIIPPGSSPNIFINGLPAATVGTMATCVGPPDAIALGSPSVFINGLPAARLGDPTVHGGVINGGSPNVIIGNAGTGAPGTAGMGAVVMGAIAAAGPGNIGNASVYSPPGASGVNLIEAAYVPPTRRVIEDQIICKTICFCNANPDISASGAKLKQNCVSSTLKAADDKLGGRSPLKAEVSYNVATTPPQLLPYSPLPDDPEIPGNQAPGYERRRPDIVVVQDVTKSPTSDNISRIVEIKFPGDRLRREQINAYRKIAGRDNVKVMTPDTCGCKDPEPERSPLRVPAPDKNALLAALLALLLLLARFLPILAVA